MKLTPVTLTGRLVRLEPLDVKHAADLTRAAADDRIWTYLDEPTPWTRDSVEAFIADALDEQARGLRLPLAIITLADERAIGSTSYLDLRPRDRGVEIGWTWTAPATWGSGINTEAKYLLLAHAFDQAGAIRVVLKTDERNQRSRRAIEALGATYEGTWRNHRILSDGHRRNSTFYSVIDTEWPAVKEQLRRRLP